VVSPFRALERAAAVPAPSPFRASGQSLDDAADPDPDEDFEVLDDELDSLDDAFPSLDGELEDEVEPVSEPLELSFEEADELPLDFDDEERASLR
jgi:hypothetical protein